MATGAAKAGPGRPKGALGRVSAELREHLLAGGVSPLEYMLKVMRDEQADTERRDKMAAQAAPYIHPKLSSTEVSGEDGGPIKIVISDTDAQL